MESAIYYPSSRVENELVMKEALLLWENLYVIHPPGYDIPPPEGRVGEAWTARVGPTGETFGQVMVPDDVQKRRAHEAIVQFLKRRDHLPQDFFFRPESVEVDHRDIYEIYPGKLLGETWWELEEAGLAGDLLPNADRPTRPWAGLTIMAKLADACAGEHRACMTDRGDAYQAIAAQVGIDDAIPPPAETNLRWAVHVTLPKIDLATVPLENLLLFREARGSAALRRNYRDQITSFLKEIAACDGPNDVTDAKRKFERRMKQDLADLRDGLKIGPRRTWLMAGGTSVLIPTAAWLLKQDPSEMMTAISLAASGGVLGGVAIKTVGDLLSKGFDLAARQEDKLLKHPMAYMHVLEKASATRSNR